MNDAPFRAQLVDYIRTQAQPPDKFSHQARLYRLACEVGRGLPHNDDVLFAAAWLHDLGVFIGHRPADPAALARWDHVVYATAQSPEILRRLGFPEAGIPAVLLAIEDHLPSRTPRTPEGTILRDADILEQMGAVGILRTVSKVGRDTRFVTFTDALQVLRRNAATLPTALVTPRARALAAGRLQTLEEFLTAASAEAGPIPW